MPIQGVNQNILELLTSTDKNIQDFISTIKTGDTLRGRVLDIIQGENKAIINFKGFNVISELPPGSTIQKGDIINVEVSTVNDQIFMKLISGPLAGLGKGIELIPARENVTPQQLIAVLNNIKVPVNEQNIFIAQKLVDYHLPVNPENINDINNALSKYMEAKGIDIRSFSIETPATAKEVVLSNFLKLSAILQEPFQEAIPVQPVTQNAQGQAQQAQAQQAQAQQVQAQQVQAQQVQAQQVHTQQVQDLQVQLSQAITMGQPVQGEQDQVNFQALSLITNPQTAEKLSNIFNIISTITENTHDIVIALENSSVVVTLKNTATDIINNFTANAVTEGLITQQEADAVASALINGQPAAINSGSVQINRSAGNDIQVRFNDLKESIEAFTTPGATGQAAAGRAAENLRDAFENRLLGIQSRSMTTLSAVSTKPDLINILSQEYKSVLENIRNEFALLKSNVLNPGGTNMEQNVKDIALSIAKLNASINMIKQGFEANIDKSMATAGEVNTYRGDLNTMASGIKDTMAKIGMGTSIADFMVGPKDFMKFQAALKTLINASDGNTVVKASIQDSPQQPPSIKVNLPYDVESTIESMAFLKSRDIGVLNNSFIDTMGKYFKDDMKLNQNLEQMNSAINTFEGLKQAGTSDRAAMVFLNSITRQADSIKQLVQQISIKPSDGNLKQEVMQQQIRDFIQNSGLNTESKLKDIILSGESGLKDPAKTGANLISDIQNAKGSLKSALIKLAGDLQNADTVKLSPAHREAVSQMRDTANDILTNLNALQFINQKPVSFDMIYTQIPVFLNSKLFNGEIQVWYRKGSLKESFERSMPVNLVFVLNTSNLGNVKISMTVYKNDVECKVSADNEKAKQLLMRGKNDFLKSLESINFNMKTFSIQADNSQELNAPPSGDGYINLGRINLQA